jgi:hypothetical protein
MSSKQQMKIYCPPKHTIERKIMHTHQSTYVRMYVQVFFPPVSQRSQEPGPLGLLSWNYQISIMKLTLANEIIKRERLIKFPLIGFSQAMQALC